MLFMVMLREAIVGETSFWFLLGTCWARSEQRGGAVEIEQLQWDRPTCSRQLLMPCLQTDPESGTCAGWWQGRGRCDLLPCTASIGVCPPQWCVTSPVVRVLPSGACPPQWCVSSPVVYVQ
jgi:hypothetical protein